MSIKVEWLPPMKERYCFEDFLNDNNLGVIIKELKEDLFEASLNRPFYTEQGGEEYGYTEFPQETASTPLEALLALKNKIEGNTLFLDKGFWKGRVVLQVPRYLPIKQETRDTINDRPYSFNMQTGVTGPTGVDNYRN